MQVELKEDFEIIEEGTHYKLPVYKVVPDYGLVEVKGDHDIQFVRGSKNEEDRIEGKIGTLHEHLLAMMIHDLKYKNDLVPSREGSLVITKLQEALGWLRQRQIDRTKRDVVGTYNE